jgi:RNA polymerase sigma factor (sigma-70 family)
MNDERDVLGEAMDDGPAGKPAKEAPPTAAERKLVSEAGDVVVRRARRIARKFPRIVHEKGFMSLGDLIGIGHQALYRAARAYRESVNPNFPAFAGYYVNGAMLDALDDLVFEERVKRAAAKAKDNHCAYQGGDDYNVMKHDGDEARRRFRAFANGVLAATFAAAVEEAASRLDITELIERRDYERAVVTMRAALARLEEKDRQLLALLYRDLMSLVDAGKVLGIPYGTLRARHARALKVLHELLSDQGIARAPRPLVAPHVADLLEARAPPPQNDTGSCGTE